MTHTDLSKFLSSLSPDTLDVVSETLVIERLQTEDYIYANRLDRSELERLYNDISVNRSTETLCYTLASYKRNIRS